MLNKYLNRGLVLVGIVLLLQTTLRGKEFPQTGAAPSLADSPKGFDRQYHEFFNAYMKGNTQKAESELRRFALPFDWFIGVFGPNIGPEIAKRYAEEFKVFELSTVKRLASIMRCERCLISLNTKAVYKTEVKILSGTGETESDKETGIDFRLPPLQRFEIHYVDQELEEDGDGTGHRFVREIPWGNGTWMDSFVYVDGAFRFFGKGAHSFWDPARIHLADPCSKDGGQPGGRIIHRVEPTYPDKAKQKNKKGAVRLLVTVAPDGTVKDVEVIDGDPILVEAAKQAVLQWRYEPFINCGKPVEMRSIEHVNFPP
jgi:TonB family protein